MPKTQTAPETTLEVRRTIAVPREKVFSAWTDAQKMSRWFAPSAEFKTIVPEFEPRVGGQYRIEMHHQDGNVHKVAGTWREILPPEKIVFTWRWERPGATETVVTVELRDLGGSTEVILTHEGLDNEEDRGRHNHGWVGCLEQLARFTTS